jgi:hypothetical protein
MMPRLQSGSVARARPGCRVRRLLLVGCGVVGLLSSPLMAQTPPSGREELLRKWDVDRDGKVDASEAEVARTRMRRTRNESLMQSGIDPVTGRPRVPTDPVTGRPLTPAAGATERGGMAASTDDGGLILVPGTGDQPGGSGGSDTAQERSPRPRQPERPALPGTRVPATSSTIPSVAPNQPNSVASPGSRATSLGPGSRSSASPAGSGLQGPPGRRDPGGGELSSRARILPGSPQSQNPGGNPGPNADPRDPQAQGAGRGRRVPAERPGVISGGVRAGGPAVRQGYGSGGPPADLNAGRLPGGLPQTRGTAAGVGGGTRGVPASQQPGAGRPALPGPPSSGMPAATRPGTQQPGIQRPGIQQPDGGRRQLQPQSSSRSSGTVPRVPRMSTDDFYGR